MIAIPKPGHARFDAVVARVETLLRGGQPCRVVFLGSIFTLCGLEPNDVGRRSDTPSAVALISFTRRRLGWSVSELLHEIFEEQMGVSARNPTAEHGVVRGAETVAPVRPPSQSARTRSYSNSSPPWSD